MNKVSKVAKIRNRYNHVPHLTQDTNGKVTNSQKTPQTRAKRSALSQHYFVQYFQLNSVQKLIGTVIFAVPAFIRHLSPTSLCESYLCMPPLISPVGSVPVRASGKACWISFAPVFSFIYC